MSRPFVRRDRALLGRRDGEEVTRLRKILSGALEAAEEPGGPSSQAGALKMACCLSAWLLDRQDQVPQICLTINGQQGKVTADDHRLRSHIAQMATRVDQQ
jgi:hypothetical protein